MGSDVQSNPILDEISSVDGKLSSTGEIGRALTERSEAAKVRAIESRGGCSALLGAAKGVRKQLMDALSDEQQKGALGDGLTPAEAFALVERYISRASGLVENVAAGLKTEELMALGEHRALESAADLVMRHNQAAQIRAKQLMAASSRRGKAPAEKDGHGGRRRDPGERPLPRQRSVSCVSEPGVGDASLE